MGKRGKGDRRNAPQGQFARLPHEILRSSAYRACSPTARALWAELVMIFDGNNNGLLWLSQSDAADRLGMSNKTCIANAFDELVSVGLIALSKEAHFSVKSGETSRARCWRLTHLFDNARRKPATNDWLHFEPANSTQLRRAKLGKKALQSFQRASDQNKMPGHIMLPTPPEIKASAHPVGHIMSPTPTKDCGFEAPAVGNKMYPHLDNTMGYRERDNAIRLWAVGLDPTIALDLAALDRAA